MYSLLSILELEEYINTNANTQRTTVEDIALESTQKLLRKKIIDLNKRMSEAYICVSPTIPCKMKADSSVHWNTAFDAVTMRNGLLPGSKEAKVLFKRLVELHTGHVYVPVSLTQFKCLYVLGNLKLQYLCHGWDKSLRMHPYMLISTEVSNQNAIDIADFYCRSDDLVIYFPNISRIIEYRCHEQCKEHISVQYPIIRRDFDIASYVLEVMSVVQRKNNHHKFWSNSVCRVYVL